MEKKALRVIDELGGVPGEVKANRSFTYIIQ